MRIWQLIQVVAITPAQFNTNMYNQEIVILQWEIEVHNRMQPAYSSQHTVCTFNVNNNHNMLAFSQIRTSNRRSIHQSQDYWLTISTIGVKHPTVKIYDGLLEYLPQLAKAQIASLLCSKQDIIEAHLYNTYHAIKINVCIILAGCTLAPFTHTDPD